TQMPSKSAQFIRDAGHVRNDDGRLWGPARWIAQLIQYMVAIIIVMIGKAFEAMFRGGKKSKRRE
ncbi:hypothetical protein K470DRAFT_215165, partial [Piedraia hortae CBS 480.64]